MSRFHDPQLATLLQLTGGLGETPDCSTNTNHKIHIYSNVVDLEVDNISDYIYLCCYP